MIKTTKNNLQRNAECFLLMVTEFGYSGIYPLQYASLKILLWVVNVKSQEQEFGKYLNILPKILEKFLIY